MDLILEILKILWRIIRALLIIILAIIGMVLSIVIWPLYVLGPIFFPNISWYLVGKLGTVKVW